MVPKIKISLPPSGSGNGISSLGSVKGPAEVIRRYKKVLKTFSRVQTMTEAFRVRTLPLHEWDPWRLLTSLLQKHLYMLQGSSNNLGPSPHYCNPQGLSIAIQVLGSLFTRYPLMSMAGYVTLFPCLALRGFLLPSYPPISHALDVSAETSSRCCL
ncbi:Coiled-coil domain-containing protein 106 [Labeo rohita]|uniref:Coiled-coil domain-containing protein 106 n=1 Tax=Labeo rohita TaxID=84645 RepID=A0A498L423_LABRO|nr:Coiled-coil domain-containing protein 106 [Labeo rohita]RXN13478.1 Coiled-coil domain-containing protein 106 [Labeo rohita]